MKTVVAAAFAAVLVIGGAQPAAADTELGDHGYVGTHKLVDTSRKPGITCDYGARQDGDPAATYDGVIKHIEVRPPKVFADAAWAAGRQQQVAWSFSVWRLRHDGESQWKRTYASPVQTTSTTQFRAARFASMGVRVILPRDARVDRVEYAYRVYVDMYWDQGGAAWAGRSTHQVDWSKHRLNGWPGGTQTETFNLDCESAAVY